MSVGAACRKASQAPAILNVVEPLPTFVVSSDVFSYWVFDHERREVRMHFKDGRVVSGPFEDNEVLVNSEMALSVFDWDKWWVENVTKRGHLVVAEAYSPHSADPLHGRPSVYLDQNHWSTVAQALTNPDRVAPDLVESALELAHLASDGGIVVPLSSAHLRETGRLDGDRRYEVGIAMASLSGGWQLRHPSRVWRNELAAGIAVELGLEVPAHVSRPVITLEPHAFLDDDVNAWEYPDDDMKLFMLAHTGPSAILDLLIGTERHPGTGPSAWAAEHQRVTDDLASRSASKAEKRQAALAFFWNTNVVAVHDALTDLGVAPDALDGRVTPKLIQRLFHSGPMLRYFSRIMVQRLVSRTTRWKGNDLTDLMFLACGNGYADYIAAENQTGTELQQLRRALDAPSTVHRSMAELVRAIRADGVATIGERAID